MVWVAIQFMLANDFQCNKHSLWVIVGMLLYDFI